MLVNGNSAFWVGLPHAMLVKFIEDLVQQSNFTAQVNDFFLMMDLVDPSFKGNAQFKPLFERKFLCAGFWRYTEGLKYLLDFPFTKETA